MRLLLPSSTLLLIPLIIDCFCYRLNSTATAGTDVPFYDNDLFDEDVPDTEVSPTGTDVNTTAAIDLPPRYDMLHPTAL